MIHLIPLAEIDEASLTRDRTALDDDALTELRSSIAVSGLRMPIEVYELAEPRGPHRYGLISGFRRLAAFRALAEMALDKARYAAIPAFVRAPKSAEDVCVQMVEENAIRAEISPWEQAMVAVKAARAEVYAGLDAAIEALYSNLSRQKRVRLRAIAHLADDLGGYLTAPETLSLRQLLRLAPLIPRGFGDLIRATLSETSADPEAQWQALLPIIFEADRPESIDPAPRPGRPRRVLNLPRQGLTVRRELTRTGWSLHFTGRDATSMLLDAVFDEIEYLFSAPSPSRRGHHRA
jgi:ParB family chromosome partitioning protein